VSVDASGDLLFTTPTAAMVRGTAISLPPHVGALIRLDESSD
jgi:hypothetical protein